MIVGSCYHDIDNDYLKYAYRDQDGWHTEVVDENVVVPSSTSIVIDANGVPHLGYSVKDKITNHYELRYAKKDPTWSIEVVKDQGTQQLTYNRMDLDSDGYPHFAYYIGLPDYDLMYAHKDGDGWHFETVDSAGNVGYYCSLVLDGNDYPHISYHAGTSVLKYAYKDVGGWNIEVADTHNLGGRWTSIALDSTEYPHICYATGDGGYAVRYAYKDAVGWNLELIDIDWAWPTSQKAIALDSSDYPHIAYTKGATYDLKYAYKDADGWHFEILQEGDGSDYYCLDACLALDDDGYAYISYYWYGIDNDLRYIYQDDDGWHAEVVDTAGDVGEYNSLALAILAARFRTYFILA